MKKIDFALISDGGSDKTLIPLLRWLLRQTLNQIPINGKWADFSRFVNRPKNLAESICRTIEYYTPDLLFVHRDAEAQDPGLRYDEIKRAIIEIGQRWPEISIPYICVVPIRMTEAWLLFNKRAIRKAAGNPNGSVAIELPALTRLEDQPDPKRLLFSILTEASELSGRNRKKFNPSKCRHLIAEYIDDYSPLFELSAFRHLWDDIKRFVANYDYPENN